MGRVRRSAAVYAVARAIADGHVKPTLADLDRLVRLESFVEGEPDRRVELLDEDLRSRTTAELKEMLREEIRELQRHLDDVEEGDFELEGEGEPN